MMMNKNNLLCTYLVTALLMYYIIILSMYSSNDNVQLSTALHRNLVYS